MGAESSVHSKLAEVGGLQKVMEVSCGGPGLMDPRRGCGDLRIFKLVEVQIISSSERKVKRVMGGARGGVKVMESLG